MPNIRGYEPTYEGLKPEPGAAHDRANCGYEPTYEGLKLRSVGRNLRNRTVTSLPMRD